MSGYEIIRKKLISIDGKDYGAYQSLLGSYDHRHFKLIIEQIPKDPYAPPHTGIYRLQVPWEYTRIPPELKKTKVRETAFRDFLARKFFNECRTISKDNRGTGNSGIITMDEPGQAILERSSVVVNNNHIEVRFFIGLPAAGRKIKSKIAETMIFEELPQIAVQALFKENIDENSLAKHLETAEDAENLREKIKSKELITFIADESILPRKSGTSEKPLDKQTAVPFISPEQLYVEFTLPNSGKIKGMGIPKGITLIVGGGYHGKSTLLKTIELGIYNHIPGDGREKCVSNTQTMKIRACSGRFVEKVDISTFIKNLPAQKDTESFSTENASGSTSQAASIQEAIEIGAEVLLMDEDTCATNFMVRDEKMQRLVSKDDEPITAYIDKAKQLFSEKGISSILVLGGAGDYFDISDKVIQMIRYEPADVTEKAHEISEMSPSKRVKEDEGYPICPKERIPLKDSIDPYNKHQKKSFSTKDLNRIHFGKTIIDLTDVEQLVELSQGKAIMNALLYIDKYIDGRRTLKEIIDLFEYELNNKGLDILSGKMSGNFAEFRGLDLAFTINRIRGIKMAQKDRHS